MLARFPVIALIVALVAGIGVVGADRGSSSPSPRPATQTAHPRRQLPRSVQPVQRLRGTNSKFNAGKGGWTPTGATLGIVTAPTHGGRGALRLRATPGPGTTMTAWSPPEPAHAGDRYVAAAVVRALTAPRTVTAKLRFIGSGNIVTDTEIGQPITDSGSRWSGLPRVVGISPVGTTGVQLGIAVRHVKTGARHVIDDATMAQTPGGSTAVVGPLHTVGNQIIQANGKPLIMRGMQRFGLESGTRRPLPTNAEVGQLKLWGANEVRISLGEQKWLKGSCHYQKKYPSIVDRMVNWVTSRGMVAMLNLHFISVGHCGKPTLTPMADSPGAIRFWKQVASRYKSNPLVAFDLFNEPYVSQSVWLHGGHFHFQGHRVKAAGMQQLYNTVRGTGAKNLVVISGLDYGDHVPTELVKHTKNVAYGSHAYQCPNFPPPKCKIAHPFYAWNPLHHWFAFGKRHPVIVTEFGWPANDSGKYNASVINIATAHGWGWSGFAWDGGTGGLFDLIDAQPASDGTTIEPNNSGMPIVAGYARNTLARSPR